MEDWPNIKSVAWKIYSEWLALPKKVLAQLLSFQSLLINYQSNDRLHNELKVGKKVPSIGYSTQKILSSSNSFDFSLTIHGVPLNCTFYLCFGSLWVDCCWLFFVSFNQIFGGEIWCQKLQVLVSNFGSSCDTNATDFYFTRLWYKS